MFLHRLFVFILNCSCALGFPASALYCLNEHWLNGATARSAPAAWSAQGTAPASQASPAAKSPELAIVGRKEGKEPADFRFKMGESLQIKATGLYATKIREELAKSPAKALSLYLGDVRMANLTMSPVQADQGMELRLHFQLVRNSEDDDNRKAWDALLQKQSGYLMTPSVALAIGNDLPVTVQSTHAFEFYITDGPRMAWILGAGLFIFVVAFFALTKNPTALRDGREGGYYSLGKSQMAFWGLLVLLSFVGVWIATGTVERIPLKVLILLGISGGTGLSAIVIGESKKAGKATEIQATLVKLRDEQRLLEEQKLKDPNTFSSSANDRITAIIAEIGVLTRPPAPHESPRFWQDICSDEGGLSFHRLQVVIWTMVLGVIFVSTVARVISMPEFPETLLILLGISNGTYLGFKIPEK